jgi:hypothetical protein
MQQHMAQQAAFSQIPDVVKGVSDPGLLSYMANTKQRHSSSFTSIKLYWKTI